MTNSQEQPEYRLIGAFTRYSSWTARVEVVLEYFNIPYTAHYAPLAQVKNISHAGLVPVLESQSLGAHIHINDSLAICEFLAESHPQLALWPRDRQLKALARSATAEMHSEFLQMRNLYVPNFLAQYTGNVPVPAGPRKELERILTVWDSARGFTKARLTELGEPDHGFLFGSFSIADAFFWPVLWRFRTYNLPLDTASADALAWMNTMWSDPVMCNLSHRYYRQGEAPETVVDKYENIFREHEDVKVEKFPEDWKFTF